MMKLLRIIMAVMIFSAFLGCSSLPSTERYMENEDRIHSLAVLPLFIGDRDGRISDLNDEESAAFREYWNNNFYEKFENRIILKNRVRLLLPGRDFEIDYDNDINYSMVREELNVDALLIFNLRQYNEVSKGAQGGQAAVAFALNVFGDVNLPTENCISSYDMHFYYLDLEDWQVHIYSDLGKFLTIEEQREAHVGNVLKWLDKNFPMSINFEE